jgi:hypothetical protein
MQEAVRADELAAGERRSVKRAWARKAARYDKSMARKRQRRLLLDRRRFVADRMGVPQGALGPAWVGAVPAAFAREAAEFVPPPPSRLSRGPAGVLRPRAGSSWERAAALALV